MDNFQHVERCSNWDKSNGTVSCFKTVSRNRLCLKTFSPYECLLELLQDDVTEKNRQYLEVRLDVDVLLDEVNKI